MTNITIPNKNTGELVAIPKKEYQLFSNFLSFIDKDQLFFWTKEWQKGELEAQAEIDVGRIKSFDSMEDFLEDLRNNDDEH